MRDDKLQLIYSRSPGALVSDLDFARVTQSLQHLHTWPQRPPPPILGGWGNLGEEESYLKWLQAKRPPLASSELISPLCSFSGCRLCPYGKSALPPASVHTSPCCFDTGIFRIFGLLHSLLLECLETSDSPSHRALDRHWRTGGRTRNTHPSPVLLYRTPSLGWRLRDLLPSAKLQHGTFLIWDPPRPIWDFHKLLHAPFLLLHEVWWGGDLSA